MDATTRTAGGVIACLLCGLAVPASAQRLAGADWELGRLYDIDPATGAAIGPRRCGS